MLAPLALDKQEANIRKLLDAQQLKDLKRKLGVDLESVTLYHPYQ